MRKWPFYHSIRGRLIFYNALVFALIFPALLICAQMGGQFLRLSEEMSNQNTLLNRFYESVQEMDAHGRSFLYTRAGDELEAFSRLWENARLLLNDLTDCFDESEDQNLIWRISLLDNMIMTYRETFERLQGLVVGTAEYGRIYDFLFSTGQNIDRTRNEYSWLLTEKMTETVRLKREDWHRGLIGMLTVMAVALAFGVAFAIVTVRGITLPLQKLVRNIQKIKLGQYDLKEINTNGYEELDVLTSAFTDMAGSISGYIASLEQNAFLENRLLEKENENLRISGLLTKTELQSLQAQMNPHFLFNTLSMLSKLAYIEGAYQTSEMMNTVADVMRYSLDKSTGASDLRSEIECLQNYIAIQNKRFSQRITFRVAVDPEVGNLMMPGMVLQPLVENAILHGMDSMHKDGIIEVKVYCDPRSVYLEVSDNGAGIEQEKVRRILSGEDVSATAKHTSIGFQNVFRRLNLFFGNRYQVKLYSEPECGTDIIITLPRTGGDGRCTG